MTPVGHMIQTITCNFPETTEYQV